MSKLSMHLPKMGSWPILQYQGKTSNEFFSNTPNVGGSNAAELSCYTDTNLNYVYIIIFN